VIAATLVLVVGCCVIPQLRRRSAAERHVLWAATMAAAAAAPVLGLILPSWQPDWVRQVVGTLPAVLQSPAAWTANDGVQIVVRANSVDSSAWMAGGTLGVIWAAGTIVLLLRLAIAGIKLARLTRSAPPLLDEPWRQTANDVGQALRLARPIALVEGENGVAPMTWGLWQPRVFLPDTSASWSGERKHVVIAHEFAHVFRSDWIVQVVSEVVCAVYWFHPLFWLAKKRLGQESEHACDDVVLGLGVDRDDYAIHLLEIARAARGALQAGCPTVAMARPSDLERRFAALLDSDKNRRALRSRQAAAVLGTAALLIVPVSAIRLPNVGTTVQVRTADLPSLRVSDTNISTPDSSSAQGFASIPRVRVLAPSIVLNGTMSPPEILEYTTPPLYSEQGRANGIEGFVTVQATIDRRGGVHVLGIVRGLGFGLDQNALVALRQWHFKAGTQNGGPIETTVEIDIEFTLRNEALNELIANDMATRVGPGVTPPRAIHTVAVPYRPAKTHLSSGTVVLDVVLQEDGTPKIVRILRSVDPNLDDSAVRAFEQWRFSPATKNGRPVKVRMNAEVTFHG
jgi:TonB family protein